MKPDVWFHCYAAGEWETPTAEFLDAAETSGLLAAGGTLRLGLVGPPAACTAALRAFHQRVEVEVVGQAEEGAEQVTLLPLWSRRRWLRDAVFYGHTKGAAVVSPWNADWRRSMILSTVAEWRACVGHLGHAQAVGCHWLSPVVYGPFVQGNSFFGGNFWWARRELIETLDEPSTADRYQAEAWLGSAGLTSIHDLTPGWPDPTTIRREIRRPAAV